MAYCVHCGVKLSDAEAKCPLCGTAVCDPAAPEVAEPPVRSYPVRTLEQTLRLNRRYAVTLLSALLLIPAALCLLADLLNGPLSWSIYPSGTLLLIWVAAVLTLSLRKHRVYLTLIITCAALAGYLYLLERLSGGAWFLSIVLPALALALAMVLWIVWLIRGKRMRILRLASLGLLDVGVLCFFIEWLCRRVADTPVRFSWSPYVLMPCLFLALLSYIVSRSGPLSTDLKRRFHF